MLTLASGYSFFIFFYIFDVFEVLLSNIVLWGGSIFGDCDVRSIYSEGILVRFAPVPSTVDLVEEIVSFLRGETRFHWLPQSFDHFRKMKSIWR